MFSKVFFFWQGCVYLWASGCVFLIFSYSKKSREDVLFN